MYFEFLPEELNEIVLLYLDNIPSINKLYSFPIFRKIYDNEYFLKRLIAFNMPYLIQIVFQTLLVGSIHNKMASYKSKI